MAAAGNVATDDDYRFLEGQGPAANVQIQEQPRPRKTGAPPPVLPQPTPADSAAGDADYAFLEGKTPPVPTAPTAPAPVAPGTTSFPAGNLTPRQMKEQLDREGLWVQNENANVQAYQKAIVGKPISPEQWQDYQQRVAELQRRSTAWQGLNAQYQGLPAATVPPIRPVQYHVTPEEQKLDAIEPALAKRGHAPSSPPVIARLKQQYGIGQAALAGTFAPRKAQLDADGARLAAEDKTLAEIGEKLQAGELPPSTEAPYMAALRQHQMNVAAYRGTAEVFNNQVNRYSAFLKKYQNEDLHLGMVYPEEVGTAPGPSASQRAFQAVSGFFQPISAAAERNLPKVRRAMMFAGQYPDLPELPRNLPPDQKQALIRQKNDLLTLVERDTRGGPLELDPLTGAMRPRTAHLNIAALTPFQKQILPIVQQQFAAEKKARELAGVENAGYIDAAAMAASLLVGGAVSKAVAGKLAGRFAPFLFDSVAAPALTSNSALFRQLLVQRVIPQVLASTAGFTVGGAAGGFTAGALLAPGKNGKPPSLTERAAFGGEAAARSAIPSAVTGIVWGTAAAIAGTVVPTFLKSRWNPETGPVANEAFTQEAVGRAKAAGVEMTPEEVGRFSRRFRVIQRSPQLAKPALWRELAGDWNSFISRRLPGEVPPPDVAGGTPATGSLGPAPAELGPAPFGGEPVPGPTITTPAGLAWDLRTRPLSDLEGLHGQLGQLQAAGQLTPEQAADYARLQRFLDGYHEYQTQQRTPPVSEAAKTAITEALTEPKLQAQFGIAPLERGHTAVADTPAGPILQAAVEGQQQLAAQVINRSFAPPDHPLLQGPAVPVTASPYRQLTPEQFAGLPAEARRALLLQDLNNSLHVVHPGALPYFSLPPNVKDEADLKRLADNYYGTASGHLSLLYPPVQVVPPPPAAPTAAPVTQRDLVPGAVIQFPNGLTVRFERYNDLKQSVFTGTVLDSGSASFVRGSTAPFEVANVLAGGTLLPAEGAPSTAPAPPSTAEPVGSPTATPGEPTATPGPTSPSLPTGGTPSPPGGPPTGTPTGIATPPTPTSGTPPIGPTPTTSLPGSSATTSTPVTPEDLRPGAKVRSIGTEIAYKLGERAEGDKWNATVTYRPEASRVPVAVGDVRQIPEQNLLDPAKFDYHGNDQPLPAAPPTTGSGTTESAGASSGPPEPTPSVSPTSGTTRPTSSPPLETRPETTVTPPASTEPGPPPVTSESSPSGSATSPPSTTTTEPTPSPPSEALPRPLLNLIDALLARINERMTADEPIFANNPELEAFAQPILGGSRAAATYDAQTVYNALEAAVNRYVIEQQFGQQEAKAALTHVADLQAALPTQTIRAGDKDALQQFSTPPTLALVAAYALQARPGENLLEPSAGTGSLLAMAESLYGHSPRDWVANEIDPERRAILDEYFAGATYAVDGRYLNAMLPHSLQFDLILMNPPFSAAQTQRSRNTNEIGFDHVAQALKRLKPGGRLVAILGRGAALDRPTAAPFWQGIAKEYTLRANIGLPGAEYRKYGTSFATQLVVIDNAGPTSPDAVIWTDAVTSPAAAIEGLYERGILERAEGTGVEPGAAGAVGERGGEAGAAPGRRRGERGGGQPAGREGVAVPAEPPAAGEAVPGPVAGIAPGESGAGGEPGGGPTPAGALPGARPEPARPGGQPDRQLAEDPAWLLRWQSLIRDRATGTEYRVTEPLPPGGAYAVAEAVIGGDEITVGPTPVSGGRAPEEFDLVQPGPLTPEEAPVGALLVHRTVGDVVRVLDERRDTTLPTSQQDQVQIEYVQVPHPDGVQRGDRAWVTFTRLQDYYLPYRPQPGGLPLEERAAPRARKPAAPAPSPTPAPTPAPVKKPAKTKAPPEPAPPGRKDVGTQYVTYAAPYVLEGRPHPAIMVETRSLAAVDPPAIRVTHSLKEQTLYPDAALAREYAERTGKPVPDPASLGISVLQLENILYAKQRFAVDLPDGSRAGLLIGDGPGAGKGRSQAGVCGDGWEEGNRRILWLSARAGLEDAAKDDLAAIGYGHIPIRLINKFAGGEDIPADFEGIIFSTYASLIQTAKSGTKQGQMRRAQLERWLAGGTDHGDQGERALILMDESHKMKAATVKERGEKPSQTAIEGMKLQQNLPRARILYSSATAMTDLDNMAYLTRLGMWGPGTPWPGGFRDFASEMNDRAKMEMIARGMKARGMYLAREISYRDPEDRPEQSVEIRTLIHPLTGQDERIYNMVADAWQVVLQNFEAALSITGDAPQAKKTALAQFWGQHQQFFRRFLTALKLPTLFADMDRELAAGRCVVIGLMSTGEAAANAAVTAATQSGAGLDDLDLTPIQALIRLVERSFPTQLYVEELGPDGETTIKVPAVQRVTDPETGAVSEEPVHDPEALALKERLLERLAAITERLPGNPLDEILFRYGHNRVAELSGRDKRLEPGPDGQLRYVPRGAQATLAEKDRFNRGEKDIAVVTPAANEGISVQAGRQFTNQKRRVHYMHELNWSADQQMQQNGRTHRSNQVSAPIYVPVATNAGGEVRFAAALARRLASMGALTRGQREATGAGGALDQYDFENEYGVAALEHLYSTILRGGPVPGLADPRQALRDMGLLRKDQSGQEGMRSEDRGRISHFFNRLLALHVDQQNPLFEAFNERFQALVRLAQESGEFDFGAQDIRGENIREAAAPGTVHTDPLTGAETVYHHVVADEPTQPVTLADLDQVREADRQGFFRRNSDQKLVYLARSDHPVNPNRVMTPANRRSAMISSADLARNFTRIPDNEQIGARRLWEEEVVKVPPFTARHFHLITGSVVGTWDRLRSAGQTNFEVRRALLPGGERIVGISLAPQFYKRILRALGASSAGVSPADLYADVLNGAEVELTGGLSLKRGTVGGQQVVRIQGVDDDLRRDLGRQGFPQERIGSTYRYSVWVPADLEQGPVMLGRLLERFPPLETGAAPAAAPAAGIPSPRRRGLAVVPPVQVPLLAPPGWSLPFPTLRWLEGNAAPLSTLFQRLAGDGLHEPNAERAHDFGILLWPELAGAGGKSGGWIGGLSARIGPPDPEFPGSEPRSVLINPFPPRYAWQRINTELGDEEAKTYQGLVEEPDPAVVADEILEAMVHELAHQEVQEEGGPLLEAISRIYQRLGREKEKEYQDGIQRLITGSDGKLTAGYLAARRGYYARARADRRAPPTLELEDALRGGRALGQIISSGGLPEPPPPGGHGGPPARRSGAGHRTEPAKLPDPGLEAQIEGAVPPSPHPLAWLIDAGRTIPGYFVRDWPFLPQKDPALAELRYRFTHLDKAWGMANMNAVLNLARVYEGLNKNDQSLYRRVLIALDMEEEVNEQLQRLVDRMGANTPVEKLLPLIALPQGDGTPEQRWTPARAGAMADWAREQLALPENQAVAEALDLRKLVFTAVLDRLSAAHQAVSGRPLTFSRREWFHHLINDFAESERHRRAGGDRVKARMMPFTLRREGSLLNYDTDDIAVELSWLPGALYNTYTYEFMAWVENRYNVKKELQKAALAINFENLMEQLDAAAAEINAKRTRGEPVTGEDLYRRRFNAPIAEGFWRLGWLCRNHPDWLPGHDDDRWENLIDQMATNFDLREDAAALMTEEPQISPEAQRLFFDWLRWLLTPPQAGQAGSGAAAQIFRGLRERRQKIKNALGLEYVTWRDLLHKKIGDVDFTGYAAWQPEEGTAFFGAWAVRDRIAQMILEAENSGTGLALNLTPEDLRRVKVMGGRKPEWVLPRAVADQLDHFRNPYTVQHPAIAAVGKLSREWKQWTLLNPLHFVGYNLRNELTDAEMIAFMPSALRYIPFVAGALRSFLIQKQLPEPDLQEWLDWGGQVSTLQAAETGPTGATLDMLAHLGPDPSFIQRTWGRAVKAARIATDLREAILRFAMYLAYRDAMLADPNGRPPNYGASDRRAIDAIGDLRLRAWALSNDLMGPYDRVPQGYKILRTVVPMPFASWKVVNMRRQLGLLSNEVWEQAGEWIVMRMPLSGGGGGAGQPPGLPPGAAGSEDEERKRRLQNLLGLRAEAKRRGLNWRWVLSRLGWASPMLIYWLGRYLVKANLLNALSAGWNWTFFRDEEEHLPPWVRYRPHIDLGHLGQPKLYFYIDRTSGVGDALGSTGLDGLPLYGQQIRAGRISVWEAMLNLLTQGPGQELYNQVGLPKTVYEFILRREGFPEWDQPRELNDRWQYFFDQLSLGKVYQSWRPNIPHHLGKLAPVVQALGVSIFHPGETAYGEMRETADNWAKDHGFGDQTISTGPETDRQAMAYWAKRAMKVNDPAAVRHFLVLYWQLGGDDKSFRTSVLDTYPLAHWPEKQRAEFLQSLDQGEQQRWRDMLWFLQQTYAPELTISKEEMKQYGHAPIDEFDDWLWPQVREAIDSQNRFEEFETTEPKAAKAREEREKMLGR